MNSESTAASYDQSRLEDCFAGCLLGLALGDALGAEFEGQSTEQMARRFGSPAQLIEQFPTGELTYTDDTQMMIGVAETLIACHEIDHELLCSRFAGNYRPQRGYGQGTRKVLQAILDGKDHAEMAATQFPEGSFGNGAAMRVAPIGLFCRNSLNFLWEQARLSALPTHTHALAIEGAQLIAFAVALASRPGSWDRAEFFHCLAQASRSPEYSGPLRRAPQVQHWRDLTLFGNSIEAASSVVTAIACFGLTPGSYVETVANAIMLGGDTDTIAAMAGAISGAHLGVGRLPIEPLARLEDRHQGKSFLLDLSQQLLGAHRVLVAG